MSGATASGSGRSSLITGLAGTVLTADEGEFLRSTSPCGIILFTRNFEDNAQLHRLVQDAREAVQSSDLLVLIDQEGGRVQRLKGADWPDLPAAAAYGSLYKSDAPGALNAARLISQWLGIRLRAVGINTNCAPCLDVPVPGADGIIGDRAYSVQPREVAKLGAAVAEGLMQAGVLPVMKHIPGHGRAGVDSHLALPVVRASEAELEQDLAPFSALRDFPAAMTAHVTYPAFDTQYPASISRTVTKSVIRDRIGFGGLLMSDDISMQALDGTLPDRARMVIAAGSDVVLHCSGDIEEMRGVAEVVPEVRGEAARRLQICFELVRKQPLSVDACEVDQALAAVRTALRDIPSGLAS